MEKPAPSQNGDVALAWWRDCAASVGARAMDCTLDTRSAWDAVLASGRHDVHEAFVATEMKTGPTLSLVEIGCGLGRLTFNLAEYYRRVMGVDVSPGLLEEAAAHNDRQNVRFALGDGRTVLPHSQGEWDVVFSAEVFHHLDAKILASYVRDAFRLLRPGGQFVFQINVAPVTWRTRLAGTVRTLLHYVGKKTWRGWPTAPGFRRKCHPVALLKRWLTDTGFSIERLVDRKPSQTWVVAVKPEA